MLAVALSLAGCGSIWAPVTVAVALTLPEVPAVNWAVTLAVAPAARLPRLQLSVPPTTTGSGVSVSVTARSVQEGSYTRVDALAVLFAETGSNWLAATCAVLVTPVMEVLVGVTTIVAVVFAPTPRLPSGQLTTPPLSLQPAGKADTKLIPAGKVSVSVITVAEPGPLLVTVRE